MVQRFIESEFGRQSLIRFVEKQKLPFIAEVTPGRARTVAQNKLQRMWLNEISEQMGDRTPEEVRGFCKLHFGVPIMRSASEGFQQTYDEVIRPLPYPAKLKLMMVPLDLPVTRIMNTKQTTQYLDDIYAYFTAEGVALTMPDDGRYGQPGAERKGARHG